MRVERHALGDEHPDVVLTHQHIAQVMQQIGALDEATEHFQKALQIEQGRRNRDSRSEAKILNQLGNVYLQQGDVDNMMATYVKASRLLNSGNQPDEALIITGYNNYGLSKMHPPCAPVA